MGTLETRSKTLAGVSGPVAEPAKPQAPKEKIFKEINNGSGSGSERTQGNGVRVSLKGKGGSGGDLGSGVVKVVKTRVVETEVSVEEGLGGGEEGGLEDSEMRGVSSLLKMRKGVREIEVEDGSESESESVENLGVEEDMVKSGVEERRDLGDKFGVEGNGGCLSENGGDPDGKIETIEVPIEDMSERIDGEEDEDMGDEGFEFSVGDFVWGKIRSHPWWPGQVYDPSDASDYAVKLRMRDRFLVIYFGDGTFAWCNRSQLKPFEENFGEMSRQSNSKSFVYAVEKAVDEIGRLVKVEMTCSCVPKENWDGLDRPLAVNSGIKEGVLVPEGGVGKHSNILSEPAELLTQMKHIAQTISILSVLELGVVKSWLAAFYRAKGFYHLPVYHESQPIPGLEDNLNDGVADTVEIPIQGPFEEDWLSSPVSPKFGQTSQTTLQKCKVNSENGLYQRRKQKSIAEIMEGNMDAHPKSKEGDTKEGINSGKPAPSSQRKKRKGSYITDGHGGDNAASVTGAKRKARMSGSLSSTDDKVSSVENNGTGGKGETKDRLSRRKKYKSLSTENDGGGGVEETNDEPVSTKRKLNSGSVGEAGQGQEQNEKASLSRERKKSKYLSPPFTSLVREQKKKDKESESLKVSNEARTGERMTRAAGHLVGSSPISNFGSETFQKGLSKELGLGHEPSDISSPRTPNQDQITIIDPVKVKASVNEVLSEVRSAALNPFYPSGSKSLEKVEGFMSILRSSIYRNGSNYKVYKKHQSDRKRKNVDSERGSFGKDHTQTDHKSTERELKRRNKEAESHKGKSKKVAKTPDAKLDRPQLKKAAGTLDMKKSDKGTSGKSSPAALFVTFGPGSSLPSKADLIKIYSKFGALNEKETDMFYQNFCARVAFIRRSDAEEAFNLSQNISPFGASNVTFRLRYPSDTTSKTRELREISQSSAAGASQFDFVRQKLEMLNSMLENSDGKMLVEMKSKLEGEIKGLLEKVSNMGGSSSL